MISHQKSWYLVYTRLYYDLIYLIYPLIKIMQPNKKEKDYTGYYYFKHSFFSFPGDCSEK